MAKLNHAPACYPQEAVEFHVVTPTGKTVYITNDAELAFKHPTVKAYGYRVIRVTTIKEQIYTHPAQIEPAKLILAA